MAGRFANLQDDEDLQDGAQVSPEAASDEDIQRYLARPQPEPIGKFAAAMSGQPLANESNSDWLNRRLNLADAGALGPARLPASEQERQQDVEDSQRTQMALAKEAQQRDLEQRRAAAAAQRAQQAAEKAAAREQAKAEAGYLRMMKDAGAVTEMGADGKEYLKNDANGNPIYKPGIVSDVHAHPETQQPVVDVRDASGKVTKQDAAQLGLVHIDPKTGTRYTRQNGQFMEWGVDDATVQRNAARAKINDLHNQAANDELAIREQRRQLTDYTSAPEYQAAKRAFDPLKADVSAKQAALSATVAQFGEDSPVTQQAREQLATAQAQMDKAFPTWQPFEETRTAAQRAINDAERARDAKRLAANVLAGDLNAVAAARIAGNPTGIVPVESRASSAAQDPAQAKTILPLLEQAKAAQARLAEATPEGRAKAEEARMQAISRLYEATAGPETWQTHPETGIAPEAIEGEAASGMASGLSAVKTVELALSAAKKAGAEKVAGVPIDDQIAKLRTLAKGAASSALATAQGFTAQTTGTGVFGPQGTVPVDLSTPEGDQKRWRAQQSKIAEAALAQRTAETRRKAIASQLEDLGFEQITGADGAAAWKPTREAIQSRGGAMLDHAAAPLLEQWRNASKPYSVDEARGELIFPDGRAAEAIETARKDGLVDDAFARAALPRARQADQKYQDVMKSVGAHPLLKAFVNEGAKSYAAMQGGAAASALVAPWDLELAAAGGALASLAGPEAAPLGATLLPMLVHGLAFLGGAKLTGGGVNAVENSLSAYSTAIAGAQKASELHPTAARLGSLAGMGPDIGGSLVNAGKAASLVGREQAASLGGFNAEAARNYLLQGAGTGALAGAAFDRGIQPFFNFLTGDTKPENHPTAGTTLEAMLMGAALMGAGMKFEKYDAKQLASIAARAAARERAGVKFDAPMTPEAAREMFTAQGMQVDPVELADLAKPLTPAEWGMGRAMTAKADRMKESGMLPDFFKATGEQALNAGGRPVASVAEIPSGGNEGGKMARPVEPKSPVPAAPVNPVTQAIEAEDRAARALDAARQKGDVAETAVAMDAAKEAGHAVENSVRDALAVPVRTAQVLNGILRAQTTAVATALAENPHLATAGVELGAQMRDTYLAPAQVDAAKRVLANDPAFADNPALADAVINQRVGVLVARDLAKVAQGDARVITDDRLVALDRLGYIREGADGEPVLTQDAVPYLPEKLRIAIAQTPENYRVSITPGAAPELAQHDREQGIEKVKAAVAPLVQDLTTKGTDDTNGKGMSPKSVSGTSGKIDLQKLPSRDSKMEGERSIQTAVADLDAGIIGAGIHHAAAYEALGFEIPDNDEPLGNQFPGNFRQGYITNKGAFVDGRNYYNVQERPDGTYVFTDAERPEGVSVASAMQSTHGENYSTEKSRITASAGQTASDSRTSAAPAESAQSTTGAGARKESGASVTSKAQDSEKAESISPPEKPAKKKTFKRKAASLPPAPNGGEDLIDYLLNNVGRLRGLGTALDLELRKRGNVLGVDERNYFRAARKRVQGYDSVDGMDQRLRAAIFAKRGEGVALDEAAQMLYEADLLPDASPDTLIDAILRTYQTRMNFEEQWKAYQEQSDQAERFQNDALRPHRGAKAIDVQELGEGDVVEVNGVELKVTRIDPDTETVTLEDGDEYGVQEVADGSVIYGKLERAHGEVDTEFLPPEDRADAEGTPTPADRTDSRELGAGTARSGAGAGTGPEARPASSADAAAAGDTAAEELGGEQPAQFSGGDQEPDARNLAVVRTLSDRLEKERGASVLFTGGVDSAGGRGSLAAHGERLSPTSAGTSAGADRGHRVGFAGAKGEVGAGAPGSRAGLSGVAGKNVAGGTREIQPGDQHHAAVGGLGDGSGAAKAEIGSPAHPLQKRIDAGLSAARARHPALSYEPAPAWLVEKNPALTFVEMDGAVYHHDAGVQRRLADILKNGGTQADVETWLESAVGGDRYTGEEPIHSVGKRLARKVGKYIAPIWAEIWNAVHEDLRSGLRAFYGAFPDGVNEAYYGGAEMERALYQLAYGEPITEQSLPWRKAAVARFRAAVEKHGIPQSVLAHLFRLNDWLRKGGLLEQGKLGQGVSGNEMQFAGYRDDFSKSDMAESNSELGRTQAILPKVRSTGEILKVKPIKEDALKPAPDSIVVEGKRLTSDDLYWTFPDPTTVKKGIEKYYIANEYPVQFAHGAEAVVYRGERMAPKVKDVQLTGYADGSDMSDSYYPYVRVELDNGAAFYLQIRVANHPNYYIPYPVEISALPSWSVNDPKVWKLKKQAVIEQLEMQKEKAWVRGAYEKSYIQQVWSRQRALITRNAKYAADVGMPRIDRTFHNDDPAKSIRIYTPDAMEGKAGFGYADHYNVEFINKDGKYWQSPRTWKIATAEQMESRLSVLRSMGYALPVNPERFWPQHSEKATAGPSAVSSQKIQKPDSANEPGGAGFKTEPEAQSKGEPGAPTRAEDVRVANRATEATSLPVRGQDEVSPRSVNDENSMPIFAGGDLDPADEAAPFYSQLSRTVANLPQETMTVAQARAAIEKGAKKDEIAMSGIFSDPLSPLNGKQPGDKVTKAELAGYALERQATVQDVVLGVPETARLREAGLQQRLNALNAERRELQNQIREAHARRDRVAAERLEDERDALEGRIESLEIDLTQSHESSGTHFSQYQLPGADEGSYREMFVTWPVDAKQEAARKEKLSQAKAAAWEALKAMDDLGFDSTAEANRAVLMHPDFAERWDIDPDKLQILKDYRAVADDLGGSRTWNDGHFQYSDITNPIVRIRRNLRTDAEGRKTYFIEEMQGPGKGEQEKMPPELRKRIYEIGMKRALRDAVDDGADAIAWTTGAQQAERYDLSKQVERVSYDKTGDTFSVVAHAKDGGGEIFNKDNVKPDDLEAIVGKEVAQKIINDEGSEPEEGWTKEYGWKEISGAGLKVGGEGLKRLYDVTLPSIANDLAKKFGVKVGMAEIAPLQKKEVKQIREGVWAGRNRMGLVQHWKTEAAARNFANNNTDAPSAGPWNGIGEVHSIEIPEALKSHAEQGMPLFAGGDLDPADEAARVAEAPPDAVQKTMREQVHDALGKFFGGAKAVAAKIGRIARGVEPNKPMRDLEEMGITQQAVEHVGAPSYAPLLARKLMQAVFGEKFQDKAFMRDVGTAIRDNQILGGYDAMKNIIRKLELRRAAAKEEPKPGGHPELPGMPARAKAAGALSAADARELTELKKAADAIAAAHDLDELDALTFQAFENPEIAAAEARWARIVNPELDRLYNELKSSDPLLPRNGRGRYGEGARVNLVSSRQAATLEEWKKQSQDNPPSFQSTFYRNPDVKRDKFDRHAELTGEYTDNLETMLLASLGPRLNELTKERLYTALLKNGWAEELEPGQSPPDTIRGEKTTLLPIERLRTGESGLTSTYRQTLAVPESKARTILRVLRTDMRPSPNWLMQALTKVQVLGVADATAHTKNQISVVSTVLANDPGYRALIANIPVLSTAHAFVTIRSVVNEIEKGEIGITSELAELARIGALRSSEHGDVKKWTPHHQLHVQDVAARVVLSRLFDSWAEKKILLPGVENKRRFVMQIGEYNRRLMSETEAWLRDAGFSPFIVAGRTFNRFASRRIFGEIGADAPTKTQGAKNRVRMLVPLLLAGTLPFLANAIMTGSIFGRKGTKLGEIDLGPGFDTKDGKRKTIDLLQLMGVRRGLKRLGLDALIAGVKNGEPASQTLGEMIDGIKEANLHPFVGPGIGFVTETLFGRRPDLRQGWSVQPGVRTYEDGARQHLEYLRSAMKNLNILLYNAATPVIGKAMSGAGMTLPPDDEEKASSAAGWARGIKDAIVKAPLSAGGIKESVSPALRLAWEMSRKNIQMAVTPDKAEKFALKHDIYEQLRNGKTEVLDAAVKAGELTLQEKTNILKNAARPPIVNAVRSLTLPQLERIYHLATDDERKQLDAIIPKKNLNAAKHGKPRINTHR